MVAGHDDGLAVLLGVPEHHARPLELARPRALRQVAGHDDDVEVALLDQRLDRLVLLGNRGVPEMHVGDVEEAHCGYSRAITASANCSVLAVPPRSRVTFAPPSLTTDSSALRIRVARSGSFKWSSIMQAASTSAPGFATPLPAMSG